MRWYHWYRDRPKKTTKSNNVSSYRPTSVPNKIPTTRSKWPTNDDKSKSTPRVHPERQANIASTQFEEVEVNVTELSLPKQDNDGYDELYSSICNDAIEKEITLQNRHSNKVPTFALAKIGGKNGASHEVCIDTGSAISLSPHKQKSDASFPSLPNPFESRPRSCSPHSRTVRAASLDIDPQHVRSHSENYRSRPRADRCLARVYCGVLASIFVRFRLCEPP